MVPDSEEQRAPARSLGFRFLHLAALSAFAVAQPLFSLLGDTADFFAVRGSTRWDIVLFGLAVIVLPPAALVAVEALAGLVSRRLGRVLHLVFVGGLAGVVAIQTLERATGIGSTSVLAGLAAAAGAAVALLYVRLPAFRSFLTVLAPAPLLFLGSFLLFSPVSELTLAGSPDVDLARVTARTPVVFVLFDELPVSSLLDERGEIDAVRYPSFGALARDATWYRNTTTVSYSTTRAVPAILTGSRSERDQLPVFAEHPRNLFTLLGGTYRMNVVETATRICPPAVCEGEGAVSAPASAAPVEEAAPLYSDVGIVYLHLLAPPRLEGRLPAINDQWGNFGRAEPTGRPGGKEDTIYTDARTQSFTQFVQSIEPGPEPSLNFVHAWFPHGPLTHFPSGGLSSVGGAALPGLDKAKDKWTHPFLAQQAYQRHLLQVGYADRLLGRLLERLHETGLYEDALVVVTADHGVAYRFDETRRGASKATLQDIAFVPLLVKPPGRATGAVVDYHVETIDILPTIAELLGIQIPWEVEGRSALTDPGRDTVHVQTRARNWRGGEAIAPFAEVVRKHEGTIARRAALFGSGDWERLFAVGPAPAVLGRSVAELGVSGSSADRAAIGDETTRELLADLDPDLPFVPSPLQGVVEGEGAEPGRTLAVAVNGRIAALAVTYDGEGETRFTALPPESAFRAGRNTVEFFWVEGPPGEERLVRLAPA